MEKLSGKLLWTIRVLLTAACGFMVGFILYNSIQNAVESARQSSRAVEVVQQVVAVVAPNSPIVTATGSAYDRLHAVVRVMAHFSEYALLGLLAGWCYRSYTNKRIWLLIPTIFLTVLACVDEWLQTFTEGRGGQFVDILVDMLGGGVGLVFALFTVWLTIKWIRKRSENEAR